MPSAHEGTRRGADVERAVEAELVEHLLQQAPTGHVIGMLAAAGIVVVLWRAAPHAVLVAWLVVMGLLSLPAFVLQWRFTRAPEITDFAAWKPRLVVAHGLIGAGWGLASLLIHPRVASPHQLFLSLVLVGAGMGGIGVLGAIRSVLVVYVTATLFPLIGVLFADGSRVGIAMGVLVMAAWAATLVLGAMLCTLTVRSVKLRLANLELIHDLSQAKDAAEAASRTKSVFLANVTHELRTPLSLILGPTRRLLGSRSCAPDARRDLETVERNAETLLKRVTDLLDVATLEAGRMVLRGARIDLGELVRRTVSLFEAVARERGVALSTEMPESVHVVVDAEKIERVVLNLLSNAMKFVSDGGCIHVGVAADGDGVTLSVEDNGPGVPEALRDAIFDRFRRGDDEVSRRFGGTGLGLAIAKELVEAHGGRIDVTDAASGGAVFRVRLPSCADGAAAADTAARDRGGTSPVDPAPRPRLEELARQTVAELQPVREPVGDVGPEDGRGLVLLVEDNADMSRYLVGALGVEHRVATAFDGREGFAKALALRPDVIVTDVMMPVMAGDVLVREVRAHPELDAVPIIVLTAKADDELRVRLLHEGAQDFLVKPVTEEELRARVGNFVMLKRARDVLQRAVSSQSHDLAILADELASASRAKDEFLALLSHELRAPLTPILGWVALIRQSELDADATRRALETIERNARLEVRIVDDLLDVSRAITGKLRLAVRPVALDLVVHAAVDSVRPAADAKAIDIVVGLDRDVDAISGDADRLQQVVWNLVSNAVKFTPHGGRVTVRTARVGGDVELTVSDTGVGIEPEFVPRLFDRFSQADSSITRTHGGLGLGLAVVRHIVELHGGTVRAVSDGKGRGATFAVRLPVGTPSPATRAAAPHVAAGEDGAATSPTPHLRGLKVLVVDDDEDTCEVVGMVLEGAGAQVRACQSSSQALAAMESWVPDILVSDIAMPGDDGYTLIRAVRARERAKGGRRVPAVALTAYGQQEDQRKALSAGFQIHVGKPIDPSDLVRIVASVSGHRAEARPSSPSP